MIPLESATRLVGKTVPLREVIVLALACGSLAASSRFERRFMALETEVHRTKRERAKEEKPLHVISNDDKKHDKKETA